MFKWEVWYCEKEFTATVICAMADNFGCRWLCCYLINLLFIFQNSEEAVFFHSWYISLNFIFSILNLIFVVEMQYFKKEMHSHKLSAMADNYPADWCINPQHHALWPRLFPATMENRNQSESSIIKSVISYLCMYIFDLKPNVCISYFP